VGIMAGIMAEMTHVARIVTARPAWARRATRGTSGAVLAAVLAAVSVAD